MMSSLLCLVFNFLLVIALCPTATAQDCDTGWFGHSCILQCHCNNDTCDPQNGNCPSGVPCASGYFGPGCQFVNVALTDADQNNPAFLMGENTTTCNNDARSTSVTLRLSQKQKLTWFRLYPKRIRQFQNFIVALDNSGNLCRNAIAFDVDANTVDVVCSDVMLANKIIIEGDMAAEVCSIYVSGGRNVALRQWTQQKNTADVNIAPSDVAVDGDTNSHERTCIKTWWDNNIPWWRMQFTLPRPLHKAVIYNNLGEKSNH